ISTFIANDYDLNKSLERGLAIAFEAKKRSEKAQGVGEQTDMYIVTKDSVNHLPDEAVTTLTTIYTKRLEQERKVVSEVEKMISDLDLTKYIEVPTSGLGE
ncbi:MAG: hypothetical protein V3T99_06595, partial [Nitrososphaerales archaeon]